MTRKETSTTAWIDTGILVTYEQSIFAWTEGSLSRPSRVVGEGEKRKEVSSSIFDLTTCYASLQSLALRLMALDGASESLVIIN